MSKAPSIVATAIADVKIIVPARSRDARGFFSETFRKKDLVDAGIQREFVQDNHSLSVQAGTVRGLHYQTPPHAQTKLVRVVRGAIFDVAVDIRRSSPTFGRHVGLVLSEEDGNQILIPPGFAHGFCTLHPNTEVLYKVDDYWFPECERGILWNDPQLGIDWPVAPDKAQLSEKDRQFPRFSEVTELFS